MVVQQPHVCTVLHTSTIRSMRSCAPRAARNDWCPATINNNFGNTTSVTSVYARYVGATVRLICKPTGLGRNWKGNGTSILVTCASAADGSTGMWVSDDWCCTLCPPLTSLPTLATLYTFI